MAEPALPSGEAFADVCRQVWASPPPISCHAPLPSEPRQGFFPYWSPSSFPRDPGPTLADHSCLPKPLLLSWARGAQPPLQPGMATDYILAHGTICHTHLLKRKLAALAFLGTQVWRHQLSMCWQGQPGAVIFKHAVLDQLHRVTWELVRKAHSQAPPRTTRVYK